MIIKGLQIILLFLLFPLIVRSAPPHAITDATTQPNIVKYCNLYKGVLKTDAGKKATIAPFFAKTQLVNGGCSFNLETVLALGETANIAATFSNDETESVLSNVISINRPATPPSSPWTGLAIDSIKGEIYASSFQVSNKVASQCTYSIDNSAFIEIPLVARDSFYSFCKIPLTGSGKHIMYYAYIQNGIWGRLEGKKTGFAYTLPTCQ